MFYTRIEYIHQSSTTQFCDTVYSQAFEHPTELLSIRTEEKVEKVEIDSSEPVEENAAIDDDETYAGNERDSSSYSSASSSECSSRTPSPNRPKCTKKLQKTTRKKRKCHKYVSPYFFKMKYPILI